MSEVMVEMVTSQLLTVNEAFARLDPGELAKRLAPEVPKMGEAVIADILPKQTNWLVGIPRAAFLGLPRVSQRIVEHLNFQFLKSLAQDMITNIDSYFNIQNCVQSQMLQDRSLLGELFKKCGQKELEFLTNSGLWFGFLLGKQRLTDNRITCHILPRKMASFLTTHYFLHYRVDSNGSCFILR